MSITLTLSSKLSPFPYAALAVAACTGTAVSYDDPQTGLSLASGESDITVEEDIVKHLAQLAGLFDDNTDVGIYPSLSTLFADSRRCRLCSSLLLPLRCVMSLLSLKSLRCLTRSMIILHSALSLSDTNQLPQTGSYGDP